MTGRKMRPTCFRLAGAALVLAAAFWTIPAFAGPYFTDRDSVHADSFGNLVIYSPAGYKRIIVGMGEAASGYQATGSYYEPEYGPEPGKEARAHRHHDGHHRYAEWGCKRAPVLLKGRSHMYGLPDGVIPVPAGPCL